MKVSLKAARVNAELTQKEVAETLGVSVDKIKYIEKNSDRIEYAFFMSLLNLYNATPDDIFLPFNFAKSERDKTREE